MKKRLWILFVMILIIGTKVYGIGTSYNSLIINGTDTGVLNSADTYGDVVAQFFGGVDTYYASPGTSVFTYVSAVSGDTVYRDTPDSWGIPGSTVSYRFRLVNRGNVSDSFLLSSPIWLGGQVWTNTYSGINVFADSGVRWSYNYDSSLGPLAEDAMGTFYCNINIPGTAAGGETMSGQATFLPIDAGTLAQDTEGYTGYNSIIYGGYPAPSLTFSILTLVQSFQLSLSKSVQVQAPSGYNGSPFDPVPGAKLLYTITYDNDGSAIDSLAINEYIPRFTDLDTATAAMSGTLGNTVTVRFSSDGAAWHSNWVSGADNRIRWLFANPIAQNNGDAVGIVDGAIPDVDAGTVTFSVIIK